MLHGAFHRWLVRSVGWGPGPALVLCALCIGAFFPSTASKVSAAPPDPTGAGALQQLQAATAGVVTVSRHPTTGAIHFIDVSAPGDLYGAVTFAQQQPTTAQLAAKSERFFADYGALFGLSDPSRELRFVSAQQDAYSYTHLTYQQYGGAVPVFGGLLRSHFDAAGKLTAVNGVAVPVDKVNTIPSLPAAAAAAIAIAAVRAEVSTDISPDMSPESTAAGAAENSALHAAATDLFIFEPAVLKSSAGPVYLAYRVEVVNDTLSIRRFAFVDAHTGKLLLILDGIHELERELSEGSLPTKVWDEGSGHPDPIPGGWAGGSVALVATWNDLIAGAKETYNLFGSITYGGWLSYNGLDAPMRTVNNDPTIQCPNANWNSVSTNYCSNVSGDDTVAHEWAHAFTENTSNLVYGWQAGALNESNSDIWGEVVDLLNGRGLDNPNTVRTAGSCSTHGAGFPMVDNSYRWLAGEDNPAFGGAIRDMWHPICYGHPGKVSDIEYTCDVDGGDNGGVHTNSGVTNHLFALLVDGGAYNNVTVNAIGLTRAAHIHWLAQSAYLTPVSDFFDAGAALQAACSDLIGRPLYALTMSGPASWGAVAPETITAQHCTAVANAMAAVELQTPPSQCDLTPILDPAAPALCASPAPQADIYLQDWETGLGGWTTGRRDGAPAFSIPNWSLAASLPYGRGGQAVFGADPAGNGDNCLSPDQFQHGVNYLQSPPLAIPAYALTPRLAFDHWLAIEEGWDGGNVKIRVNNGPWTLLPSSAILFNSYNGTLRVADNTNPLAGEPAYSGSDKSSVRGSWGQTQIDLAGYAGPGDTVELRFELGFDDCGGLHGWYVDDVHLYTCSALADVGLAQQVSSATALPGQPITYQLTVANPSPQAATSVVLTDVLSGGLAVNSFSAGGTLLQGPTPAVRWSLPSLAASSQQVFTVSATVDPAIAGDLTLTTTATVTASGDALAANNTAAHSIGVVRPSVGVPSETLRVPENAGEVAVPIRLVAPNPYAGVAVTYLSVEGSATPGSDYAPEGGTVAIPAGATTVIVPLTLTNDTDPESEEQFQIHLSAATGAKIGQDTVTIQIGDDDANDVYLPQVKR